MKYRELSINYTHVKFICLYVKWEKKQSRYILHVNHIISFFLRDFHFINKIKVDSFGLKLSKCFLIYCSGLVLLVDFSRPLPTHSFGGPSIVDRLSTSVTYGLPSRIIVSKLTINVYDSNEFQITNEVLIVTVNT